MGLPLWGPGHHQCRETALIRSEQESLFSGVSQRPLLLEEVLPRSYVLPLLLEEVLTRSYVLPLLLEEVLPRSDVLQERSH